MGILGMYNPNNCRQIQGKLQLNCRYITMTSKTLSTGTLSLRFMQNASRAKQLKEVELDRAEVHDDGKWEIGQAAKDVWGPSSNAEPS